MTVVRICGAVNNFYVFIFFAILGMTIRYTVWLFPWIYCCGVGERLKGCICIRWWCTHPSFRVIAVFFSLTVMVFMHWTSEICIDVSNSSVVLRLHLITEWTFWCKCSWCGWSFNWIHVRFIKSLFCRLGIICRVGYACPQCHSSSPSKAPYQLEGS